MAWLLRPDGARPAAVLGAPRLQLQLDEPHLRKWAASHRLICVERPNWSALSA
jgi:hypothetical protein